MSTRTDTLFPYATLYRSPNGTACRCLARWLKSPVNTCAKVRRCTSKASCRPASGKKTASSATPPKSWRSEEHTSELQSLMRISYDVFCLQKTRIILRHHSYKHTSYNKTLSININQ